MERLYISANPAVKGAGQARAKGERARKHIGIADDRVRKQGTILVSFTFESPFISVSSHI